MAKVVIQRTNMLFHPPRGSRVKVLPRDHQTIHVGSHAYYYMGGVFYRPGSSGYIAVNGPISANIRILPAAAVLVTIGASSYYITD